MDITLLNQDRFAGPFRWEEPHPDPPTDDRMRAAQDFCSLGRGVVPGDRRFHLSHTLIVQIIGK